MDKWYMYRCVENRKTIVCLLVFLMLLTGMESCNKENGLVSPPEVPKGSLELIGEQLLEVTEPSGLAFGPGDSTLLVVSDYTNKIYELSLNGAVIRQLAYTGNDLEGVTYNRYDRMVAIAEERKRQVVILDYAQGNEQSRADIPTGGNTDNKGLEGIAYNDNNRTYYMVNEALPGEMIIWAPAGGVISTTELHFASDYSGIFIDANNGLIYLVSDESQTLYKCNYNVSVIKEYPLPETKFEGIAVDSKKNLVYLVNDKTQRFYIFKMLD